MRSFSQKLTDSLENNSDACVGLLIDPVEMVEVSVEQVVVERR